MYTFKKEERLCNKRLIDGLFHNGSSFLCYPYRVSWQVATMPQPMPVQVVFPVSKKRFRRAVDRNTIKRLSREVYRLNKHVLYNRLLPANKQLLLSVSYIGKELNSFAFMQKKMLKAIEQLCAEVIC